MAWALGLGKKSLLWVWERGIQIGAMLIHPHQGLAGSTVESVLLIAQVLSTCATSRVFSSVS